MFLGSYLKAPFSLFIPPLEIFHFPAIKNGDDVDGKSVHHIGGGKRINFNPKARENL